MSRYQADEAGGIAALQDHFRLGVRALVPILVLFVLGCVPKMGTTLHSSLVSRPGLFNLSSRAKLRVRAGAYRLGAIIGSGAGQDLTLSQSVKSLIQSDLDEAFSIASAAAGAPYVLEVSVDNLSIEWPKGVVLFNPRVTAKAEVKMTVTVRPADGQKAVKPYYRKTYLGLASGLFGDYRLAIVGSDWQRLVNEAYQRCLAELLGDQELIAQLRRAPGQHPVSDPPSPIVAVFDIRDRAGKLRDRPQIDTLLSALLSQKLGFRLVPRDQLRQRLKIQKKESYRQCYTQSCQIELGKALAARQIFTTEYIEIGGQCAFVSALYDLRTETTIKSVSVKVSCDQDNKVAAIEELVRRLGYH